MKPDELPKPVRGINNVANETDIAEGFVRSAINVDIDKEGNVSRREGYTKIHTGTKCHSLYKGFFVDNNTLKHIDANDQVIILDYPSKDSPLSYCELNDEIIFTDGTYNKKIYNGFEIDVIAPDNPIFQPTATIDSGSLSGGAYQYALCNVTTSGMLSGTDKAEVIEINHGAGIKFTNMDTLYEKALFVSDPNGTELYLRAIVPKNSTEYVLGNFESKGISLDTQFMYPLPGGSIIRAYKGKLYVVDEHVVWFSQAHRYGLHKPSEDFFQFPAPITVFEPVEDGIFVVADKTYFLRGTDSDNVVLSDFTSKDTAIPGTGTQVTAKDFGIESEQDIAFWVSNKGLVLGLPGGTVKNLTEENVAIDTNFIKGTSMYREVDGKKQILTALNGGGDKSTFTSSDTLTSTIIRNGVEIT